jgi:hypothetical protein
MGKRHKWADVIVAWSEGAEIEQCSDITDWHPFQGTFVEDYRWQFRIKPQPKEPQYLKVYGWLENENICFNESKGFPYIGKIKLEEE